MHRTQDMDEKRSFNLFLEFIYKLIHNLSPFTTTGFLHKFHQRNCAKFMVEFEFMETFINSRFNINFERVPKQPKYTT